MLLIIDGQIGVINFDRGVVSCCVCCSKTCLHASYVDKHGTTDNVIPAEFQHMLEDDAPQIKSQIKLMSCRRRSVNLTTEEQIVYNKPVEELFRMITIDGTDFLIIQAEFGDACINCGSKYDYSDPIGRPYRKKYLLTQKKMYLCAGIH